ncbi:hypothetical protein AVL63_02790 [Nesterenkonia jeotgali]|uniref:Uncharacterized protein n=2 Tax=Nesterenkonia jeotgali TaxID=317018 RepID=A0A0W8IG79_9MICC|nr:hypothetical protein AVL63_02790 [Nesterenkonia jeotgali]
MHGGRTEKAKARAQVEMISKTLGEDLIDPDADPAEMLLELCRWKQAECLWLRAKVQAIPDEAGGDAGDGAASLTYGLTRHEEGVGAQGPVDVATYEVAPNIWWKLLREAEDQLAKYSTAALRAGVERRQIELQEAHALHLAQAITRILDQLGLSQDQARLVPTVVPAVLRSLPVAGGGEST